MSVQHAEPADSQASDPDQSPHPAKDDPAGAAALSPAETIERITQALRRQQVELETQYALLRRAQAAVIDSEERLDLALAGAKAGIWDWDTLTGALHWTPQMERLYGLPAETIRVDADWRRCVVPEDLARIQVEQSAALAQRIPFETEFRIIHGDGSQRWISSRGRGLYNETGNLVRVLGINQDITQRKQTEAALRVSEARFRSQFAAAPTPTFVWQVVGRQFILVDVNAAADRLARDKARQFLGMTADQLYPDRPDLIERFHACLAQQSVITYETDYHSRGAGRDGVIVFTFAFVSLDLIMLHAEDVTERRQAEAALKQSQQNLARAQQIGRLGSWEWDVPNQTLFWSDELYRIYGVERDFSLTYAAIEAAIHPDDRARNSAKVQEALTAAAAVDFEFRIVRPDGAVRHLHQSIEIARDETGAAYKLFGVMQDVTERKAATEALLRSEANLRAMFENTDAVIALRDREGRLAAFNSSFARLVKLLFGVEAQPGLRTMDLHAEAGRAHWEMALAKVYAGADYREDFTWEVLDATRHYELSLHPIWHDGEVIGSTEFTRDITARKQAEQEREHLQAQLAQAQELETIGRLASGIAHDFNNLLAVILMRTELALQMADPATPLHYNLTVIYTTAQRSAEQVRNLLGFARRQVIAPRVIDLNDAVESTLPMLHQVIGEEIELFWRPGGSLWPVKLDPAQIDQMLANLGINARDAIGGVGAITMETANITLAGAVAVDGQAIAPGDYVLLAVSDTGSGLDAEAAAHLFDPYFRTTTVGTGLGLATVEGIMQQNGGQIQVINDPGVGKTIKLLFPPHRERTAATDSVNG